MWHHTPHSLTPLRLLLWAPLALLQKLRQKMSLSSAASSGEILLFQFRTSSWTMLCQVHSATAGTPDRPGLPKEDFGHDEGEKCGGKGVAASPHLPRGHLHKQVLTNTSYTGWQNLHSFTLQECSDNISLGCFHSGSASSASHNKVEHTSLRAQIY